VEQEIKQNIELEVKLTIKKEQAILFEWMRGRRTMQQMASKEYLPLTDPNRIDVADKKQVHQLICKPCHPRYDERQKANKNPTAISVQGDARWDQQKGRQAYNFDSGTHLLVGNKSLRAVVVETLSRRCSSVRTKPHTLTTSVRKTTTDVRKVWRRKEPGKMFSSCLRTRTSSSKPS
jgi:hypothetical protein